MNRITALLAAALVALVLAASTSAMGTATKLTGTVGPGFTITLKKGTSKVAKLRHGNYTVVVHDKSAIHNFHLKGPGVDKKTSVKFDGSKTWHVTLKKGKYTYLCDPHKALMTRHFTAT